MRGTARGSIRRLTLLCSSGAASLAACAVVAEVALRVLYGAPHQERSHFDVFRSDAQLGYALRPSWSATHTGPDFRVSVRTNALGMRGAEIAEAKPPGSRRILVLGDSFAFGWGVGQEESFPRRLEQGLREGGVQVEVLNAAVPGYAADQHWIRFDQLRALGPDLLLLALSTNDAEDLTWHDRVDDERGLPLRIRSRRRFVDRRGRLRYPNGARLLVPRASAWAPAWLVDHSRLYGWARYRLARAEIALRARRAPARVDPDDFQRVLREHDRLVAALEARARERGVAMRVAMIGDTNAALAARCREAGVRRCLDLTTRLDRREQPDSFLPIDGHWSALGHARAARALEAWLRAEAAIEWLAH